MGSALASGCQTIRQMFWTLPIVTAPYSEPMHIAEARDQTNLGCSSTADEDRKLKRYIVSARTAVEADTMRALVYQRRSLTLDYWPGRIDLYCCPVWSVESIAYYDAAGDVQTLATSVYRVRTDREPATISLKSGQTWPTVLCQSGSITVTFTAGYVVPFVVNTTTNVLTFIDYAPVNGESFRLSNSGGVLPDPLDDSTLYYIVNASGSTCKLSLTMGGSAIDLTTYGSGIHFLGQINAACLQAMRKRVAWEYADREGSAAAAACEQSYFQSLRAAKYTFE